VPRRCCEVAGRGARENIEAEFERAGGRYRYDAILVRERRMIDGVVLDVQLAKTEAIGQTRAAHERREPRVEPGAGFTGDGEQFPISPEVLRAPFDFLPGDLDGGVIVDRLQRAQAFLARPQRLGWKLRLTQVTLQADKCAHTTSPKPHPGSVVSETTKCERLGRSCSFPYLPFLTAFVRRQELAPNRDRGDDESVAWLPWLRRACPSATLDKQSVFSCPEDYSKPPVSATRVDEKGVRGGILTRNTLRP